MYPITRPSRLAAGGPFRRRTWWATALPWIFALGVAAGSVLPIRQPWRWPWDATQTETPADNAAARDAETLWRRAGHSTARHPVDVLRTLDGDTFEARVHLWPGLDLMTRVRLRGVDAPEMKAACAEEQRQAEAAKAALRDQLGRGEVAIYNIGPDKYQGRVVADVATREVASVSEALIAAGHVRRYGGGRREGWCPSR